MSVEMEQSAAPQNSAPDAASLFAAPAVDDTATPDTNAAPETDAAEESGSLLADDADAAALLHAEDDSEEIDYEGEKLKIPKKLKDAFLRQKDYTQKTQEVAEQRRAIEGEREQLQQFRQFQQENVREIAQLHGLDDRMAWLAQNMRVIAAQDPVKGQEALMEFTQLQTARGQLAGSLAQKNQQMQLAAQSMASKRANDAEAVVMREVKNWSPKKYAELQDFARSNGVEPETLRQLFISSPQVAKVFDTALQHTQFLKQRTAKPAPAPLPKPVTKVGGGSATNTKSLSDLTPEEYAAKRRERMDKRR
jgi:hypothetical protein